MEGTMRNAVAAPNVNLPPFPGDGALAVCTVKRGENPNEELNEEVDAQKNRATANEAIEAAMRMADQNDFANARMQLKAAKDVVNASKAAHNNNLTCMSLMEDLDNMEKRLTNDDYNRFGGKAFMTHCHTENVAQRSVFTRATKKNQCLPIDYVRRSTVIG
jgi:hypothetical protein